MQIGSVQLDGNIALAPMAGVTDLPFRLLCREAGSAFAVTEMVSAKGYLCAASGNRATQALLLRAPQEGPVALQLFGKEPEVMAEAARRLSDRGFCMIDLNMGCPAPKIAGAGEGAALLKEPVLAARIVESVVRATHLPVTVKMRIGWDDAHRCAVPFARMIEASGAKAITVHGRTRMQFYAGMADWQAIAEVKAALQIPVWGNGDVASAMDAQRMQAQTGC
ncbi:MAG: tRNA-dihydrouridine synthase family protein, partial [Clostridia bacterium]